MFSIIRDFFLQFLNPLAFVGVVLFVSLFLIKKKPNTAIWFVVICLLVISIFGNPYFSTFLTRSKEWRHMPSQAMANADAILLIADGTLVSDTPRQRVEVDDEADGVLYSAGYYQQKLAPVIIVSGDEAHASSAKTLLMELGVPEEAILLQLKGSNLRQDISRSLEIIQDKDMKSVILVTSALKMDRTMFLLRESGLNVIPAPTGYQVTLKDWQNLTSWRWQDIITHLLPTSKALEQTAKTLWEYFGLTFYRIRAIF